MKSWLDLNAFLGVSATQWLYAIAAAAIAYVLLSSVLRLVTTRLDALSRRTSTDLDTALVHMLKGTRRWLMLLAALLIGAKFLDLPARWDGRLDHLWFLVIGLQLALWLNRGVAFWTRLRRQNDLDANPVISTVTSWILRAVLWSVLLLSVLANMGVNITAFVASLGVGGVAVALAVQNILSDLFASLAIGLDQPFEVGDFIVFGDVAGTIEHVGLKTTRIRSLGGEQIICGNTELLKNVIHNYKRMAERRILFTFRVVYDATPEQLRAVPELVQRAVEAAGTTRFDRAHLKEFSESGIVYEVVYYVLSPDYNVYMDVQQAINLDLVTGLRRLGIGFALPRRVVDVVQKAAVRSTMGRPVWESGASA